MKDWAKESIEILNRPCCSGCVRFGTVACHTPDTKPENGPCPEFKPYKNITLEELKAVMGRWLHLSDPEVVDVVLVASIAVSIPGDPLWLMLIGPPGSIKTETLRGLSGKKVHSLDQLTPHTLITGLKSEDAIDLLPLLDGKLLVVKDFSAILSDERNLNQILADFRGAYDGYLEKGFGSGVGVKRYESRFGLIAASTGAIDRYWSVAQQLGDRMLKFRVRTDKRKAEAKAFKSAGQEKEMRATINRAMSALMGRLESNLKVPEIPRAIEARIEKLAGFAALFRSEVMRDRMHHIIGVPDSEVGTRLAKQFKKLALSLAVVREHGEVKETEYDTLRRVAMDTVPSKRMRIVKALPELERVGGGEDGEKIVYPKSSEVGQHVRLPTTTTTEELEDLWGLGILERHGVEEREYRWELKRELRDMMAECGIIETQPTLTPPISMPPTPTPGIIDIGRLDE